MHREDRKKAKKTGECELSCLLCVLRGFVVKLV